MPMMRRCLVAMLVMVCTTGHAVAQTSDDFFNPDVLQRGELWMKHSR